MSLGQTGLLVRLFLGQVLWTLGGLQWRNFALPSLCIIFLAVTWVVQMLTVGHNSVVKFVLRSLAMPLFLLIECVEEQGWSWSSAAECRVHIMHETLD